MDRNTSQPTSALIIAAGAGARLQNLTGPQPKPLIKILGLPLIKRIILTGKRAGIKRFVIVTGYEQENLRSALSPDSTLADCQIEWVHNDRWDQPNGDSALAAKPYFKEPFILLMADHLFDKATLEKLIVEPFGTRDCVLAIDRKIDGIYDLDDATKVRIDGELIVEINKNLQNYNAIDTGMFLCTSSLFDALESVNGPEGCSLSDGIRVLARDGRMRPFDIGEGFWQDVDTPKMLSHSEKTLLQGLTKPTDGWISRFINRPISTRITKWLVKTPITPNVVTLITFLFGLLGAGLVLDGSYWMVLIGALFFQMSSILDGCDGEVAVLTFRESKYGSWLDTITDNLTYLAFFSAIIWAYAAQNDLSVVMYLGMGSVIIVALAILVMYYYLIQTGGSGSLVRFNKAFEKHTIGRSNLIARLLNLFRMMCKRDFFTVVLFGLAALGLLSWMFWLVTVGGLCMGLAIFISTGRLLAHDRTVKQDL